MQCFVIDIQH